MDANDFQFSLTVPRDPQFVPTIRRLAVQVARYATCSEAEAEAFGGSVEKAVRASLQDAPADAAMSVVVQRNGGPVEVRIDGLAITVEP